MTPRRIQLSRREGWRKPAHAVVVARPGKWGNPYRVGHGQIRSRRDAVECFREGLVAAIEDPWAQQPIGIDMRIIAESLTDLRGRDLACWCPLDQPCHADVLLELANASDEDDHRRAPRSHPSSGRER